MCVRVCVSVCVCQSGCVCGCVGVSCAGSALLCESFLCLQRARATLHCSAQAASHCGGFSCSGVRSLGCPGFSCGPQV